MRIARLSIGIDWGGDTTNSLALALKKQDTSRRDGPRGLRAEIRHSNPGPGDAQCEGIIARGLALQTSFSDAGMTAVRSHLPLLLSFPTNRSIPENGNADHGKAAALLNTASTG